MQVRVDFTTNKGRGVFAPIRFRKGELIERAPVQVMPNWQWCHIDKTLLTDYCFLWGDEMALPFGAFIFYNHSYSPNAYYAKRLDDGVIEMFSLRDIEAGEEILINYNGDPGDDTPMWFVVED